MTHSGTAKPGKQGAERTQPTSGTDAPGGQTRESAGRAGGCWSHTLLGELCVLSP